MSDEVFMEKISISGEGQEEFNVRNWVYLNSSGLFIIFGLQLSQQAGDESNESQTVLVPFYVQRFF